MKLKDGREVPSHFKDAKAAQRPQRAAADALPALPGTPSHDIPIGSVAETLFKPVPFSDPRVALAADVVGLGMTGAGLVGSMTPKWAQEPLPRELQSPMTPEEARTMGQLAREHQSGMPQKERPGYQALNEAGLNEAETQAMQSDLNSRPPLNPQGFQKMLGDMFGGEAPPPAGWIQTKGGEWAPPGWVNKHTGELDWQQASTGHSIPSPATVEDLLNRSVWGGPKGPYQHSPTIPGSRLEISEDARARVHVENSVNATMRDIILTEENFGGKTENVTPTLNESLLRPNTGATLNSEPLPPSTVKRKQGVPK